MYTIDCFERPYYEFMGGNYYHIGGIDGSRVYVDTVTDATYAGYPIRGVILNTNEIGYWTRDGRNHKYPGTRICELLPGDDWHGHKNANAITTTQLVDSIAPIAESVKLNKSMSEELEYIEQQIEVWKQRKQRIAKLKRKAYRKVEKYITTELRAKVTPAIVQQLETLVEVIRD